MKTFLKFLRILSYIFPTAAAYKALSLFLTPKKYKRPEPEKPWYNSARKNKLQCGYAVNEWGVEGAPKVLLVHGWEGRASQMGAFAQPLVRAGFHVIALDGPAHGDSDGEQTNAGEYSRALVSVQNELGHLKAVVGHSFGGGCSILAMNMGMRADKFVTISSPSDYAQVVVGFLKFVKMSPMAERAFYSLLTHRAGLKIDELSISQLGSKLNIPILIVHDENDKEVPFINAENLKAAWSQAELLKTENLGHRRILKDDRVIQEIVGFIYE